MNKIQSSRPEVALSVVVDMWTVFLINNAPTQKWGRYAGLTVELIFAGETLTVVLNTALLRVDIKIWRH